MTTHDPTYPLFPILSFIGFLASFIPLPWYIQACNTGTCALMVWTGLACFVQFVNSVVWAGNTNNIAPIWCDVSSKYTLGAGVGITASTLCISRRLFIIASSQTVSTTRADKRGAIIIDMCIAVGIPFIVMALHYIVQGHRFDIFEDVGCWAVIYNTLPSYFLVFMWPIVLGTISLGYSLMTLRSFYYRRVQFAQLVKATSSMSVNRYFRLMLLAFTDITLTLPLGALSIHLGTKDVALQPWISWEETHYNFSRIGRFPAVFWKASQAQHISVELTRWIFPLSAFIFFGLFGFSGEALIQYKKIAYILLKPFGFKPSIPSVKPPSTAFPSFVKRPSTSASNCNSPREKSSFSSTRCSDDDIMSASTLRGESSAKFSSDSSVTCDITIPPQAPYDDRHDISPC